jgi:hypothetical protein
MPSPSIKPHSDGSWRLDLPDLNAGGRQPVTSPPMLNGWGGVPTARHAAGIVGLGAFAAMGLIGGCTTVTGGDATVDAADAPAYRTSVAVSVSASLATSSARESERQESLTTAAIHTACETLSTSSADAIAAVNAYVDAMNGDSNDDPVAVEGAAAAALDNSADLVATDVDDTVPTEIRDALAAWVAAARGAASVVVEHQPPAQFNAAIRQLNDTRGTALNLCDAHY